MSAIHSHDYLSGDQTIAHNERKTLIVVLLTAVTMVAEIIAGSLTGSMALLADGWHMASHAGALFISILAYRLAKSSRLRHSFTFGAGKFIPLGGYTSAIVLALIALAMAWESTHRIFDPVSIQFDEAIVVATVGLLVNIVSAVVLSHSHEHEHEHEHDHKPVENSAKAHHHGPHDHNIRSAYVHVLADAVTSIFAIAALVLGRYFAITWLDPVMGIIGSLLILIWAFKLCRETAWELLDGHAKAVDHATIRGLVENATTRVVDLHVWRVAPRAYACEMIVVTEALRGPDFYRNVLLESCPIHHVIVEERLHAKS